MPDKPGVLCTTYTVYTVTVWLSLHTGLFYIFLLLLVMDLSVSVSDLVLLWKHCLAWHTFNIVY